MKQIIERELPGQVKYRLILRALIVALSLLLVCIMANASPKPVRPFTKDEVINTYLGAVVHGRMNDIDYVIDNDAEFNITLRDNVTKLNKTKMLNYLKSTEDIEQDCTCSTWVVQDIEDGTFTKRALMEYNGFTRTDVITVKLIHNNWKITKVKTSFK
jgi:hypothetical protein